ncbi:MAG: amino acid ABC transporter substrate-binding protein [Pseudomonadota bacterium]
MIRLMATVSFVGLGLAAWDAPLEAQEQPITIGASLPLTGNFSVSGQKHKEGYELCVDKINEAGGLLERSVELIVSDNRSDVGTAMNQYERLINAENVDLLFGTFSSKLTFPTTSVTEQYDMVHPIPAGGALRIYTRGHDKIFYFQASAAEYTGATLRNVIEDLVPEGEGPTKAAIVHADDFFANAIAAGLLGQKVTSPGGEDVADLSPGYLQELKIEPAMIETWPEEGFSDWLNLANSIRRANVDIVIALTASAEEAVQLTRALQTLKVQPKLVYMSQGTQAEYYEGVGDAGTGVLVHSVWHADAPFEGVLGGETYTNQDFIDDYQERYGYMPDEDAAIPFAVCQGIEQAVRGAGTTDNVELANWLHARTEDEPVQTILGRYNWDERGLPEGKSHLMTQWQGDQLTFVYPTDEFEGTAPMIYPKPEW